MAISRRTFLTLSGATLLTAALPVEFAAAAVDDPDTLVGRALRKTPVYQNHGSGASVVKMLWPDTIIPVLGRSGRWYTVPDGFVAVADVQSMLPYEPHLALSPRELPAWLTVVAPVAPIREWADGTAPLVTRVGYGGVLCAVDQVVHGRETWYAVSDAAENTTLGWTPALRWSATPVFSSMQADAERLLHLEQATGTLAARENGQEVLRAPVLVPSSARAGVWRIDRRQPTFSGAMVAHHGAAWVLHGSELPLYGAYWHNDFGAQGNGSGWEVSPWVARWLYEWLPDGSVLEVS